jgi:hypothetical protein
MDVQELSSSKAASPPPKRRDEEKQPGSLYTKGTIGLSFEEPDDPPSGHNAVINKMKGVKRMILCCVGFSLLLLLAVIVAASLALIALRDEKNGTSGQNAFEPTPPSTAINLSPWSSPISSRRTASPSTPLIVSPSTPPPTMAPTTTPTIITIVQPTTDEFQEMRQRILLASPSSQTALSLASSPQYQALQWLSWEYHLNSTNSDTRVVQRWVMATIFYSLGGSQWTRSENWLGEVHECTWFSANPDNYCDQDGNVVGIDLTNNALIGTIPDEVSLLSNHLGTRHLSDPFPSPTCSTRVKFVQTT